MNLLGALLERSLHSLQPWVSGARRGGSQTHVFQGLISPMQVLMAGAPEMGKTPCSPLFCFWASSQLWLLHQRWALGGPVSLPLLLFPFGPFVLHCGVACTGSLQAFFRENFSIGSCKFVVSVVSSGSSYLTISGSSNIFLIQRFFFYLMWWSKCVCSFSLCFLKYQIKYFKILHYGAILDIFM